jgi:hypothetical protein
VKGKGERKERGGGEVNRRKELFVAGFEIRDVERSEIGAVRT